MYVLVSEITSAEMILKIQAELNFIVWINMKKNIVLLYFHCEIKVEKCY